MTAAPSANGHRPGPPRQAVDWDREDYRPDPKTPLRLCGRCGAKYLDDEAGRAAHRIVFLHQPRTREPDRPAESTEREPPPKEDQL